MIEVVPMVVVMMEVVEMVVLVIMEVVVGTMEVGDEGR